MPTSARERVAAECVTPMVDRQRTQACQPQDLARRQEPPPDCSTLERFAAAMGLDGGAPLLTAGIRVRIPTGPALVGTGGHGSSVGAGNGIALATSPAPFRPAG